MEAFTDSRFDCSARSLTAATMSPAAWVCSLSLLMVSDTTSMSPSICSMPDAVSSTRSRADPSERAAFSAPCAAYDAFSCASMAVCLTSSTVAVVSLVEAAVWAVPAATCEAIDMSSVSRRAEAARGRLQSAHKTAREQPGEKETQDDSDPGEHTDQRRPDGGVEPILEPDHGDDADDDHVEHHQTKSDDQPTLDCQLVAEPDHSDPLRLYASTIF